MIGITFRNSSRHSLLVPFRLFTGLLDSVLDFQAFLFIVAFFVYFLFVSVDYTGY